MRTHSLLLLSSGLLLGTTALTGVSHAQKGINLTPKTKWAVSEVGGGTEKGYCAIARRFDKNVIMTLARNKKNENSIALDFQTGSFDQSKSYNVYLDPGAGQQRQFSLRPVSAKAFVFRIGSDRPFLNALDRTGYMRVEIGNEIFNLNLADIDKGQAELAQCVQRGMQEASEQPGGSNLTPVGETRDAAEHARIRTLQAENARLKAQLDGALQSSNARPASSLTPVSTGNIAQFKAQIESLEQENRRLQNQYTKANRALSDNQGQAVANLARENMRLQKLVDELKSGSDNAELSVLQSRLSALEEENLALDRKLKQAQNAVEEVSSLEQQLRNLRIENSRLEEMASARPVDKEELAALEAENTALSEKILALHTDHADALTQLEMYEGENDVLKQRLASTATRSNDEALLAQLREQLRTIEKRNERMLAMKDRAIEEGKKRLEASRQAMQRRLDKEMTERLALEDALDNMKQQFADTNAADTQTIADAREKIRALESDLENANMALADAGELQEGKQLSEARSAEMEAKIASLESMLSSQEQAMAKHGKYSEQALEEADAQIAMLEDKLSASNQSIEAYETQLAALNAEMTELQSSYDLALLNESAAQQKLTRVEKEKSRSEERIAQLEQEQASMLNMIETAAGGDDAAIEEAQQKVAALEEEKQEALERLQALQDEKDAAEVRAEAIESERLELEEQVAALIANKGDASATIEKLRAEKEKALERVAVLEDDIADFNAKYAALEERAEAQELEIYTELSALQEQVDGLQLANEELKRAVDSAEIYNAALLERNEEAYARIETMKAENAKRAETVVDITEEFPDTESEEKLAALESENEKLKEAIKVQESQMQALVQAHKSIDSQAKAEPQTQAAAPQNDGLVEQMKAENAMLEERLAQMQIEMEAQAHKARQTAQAERVQNDDVQTEAESGNSSQEQTMAEAERSIAQSLNDLQPSAGKKRSEVQVDRVEKEPEAERQDSSYEVAAVTVTEQEPVVSMAPGASFAQQQEAAMKRRMESGIRPAVVKAAPTPQPATVETQASRTVDDVVSDMTVEKRRPVAAAPGMEGVRMMDSVYPEYADAPVQQHEPTTEPILESVTAPEATPTPTQTPASSGLSLDELLRSAKISLDAPIERVERASIDDVVAYQWQGHDVYGSATQRPMAAPDDFDVYVREYLEKTEKRCTGDFAVTPAMTTQNGQTRIDGYEIACVGQDVNSSASLLFYNKDGVFTALAHEAPIENMGMAMDMRDRVAQTIKKARI